VSEDRQLKAIATAALLHDMGKLAIPEHILNKPGKLTTAEFDKMKRHADIGADLLSSVRFPYPVVPIVRHHHENWDGTGYPAGIAGTDIPLGARILAVVDCFDALTSDRPYRPRLTPEDAFAIVRERRARMYDPLVVDTFIRTYSEIAPLAISAGLEARSLVDATSLAGSQANESSSLAHIRTNAIESAILEQCSRDIAKAVSTSLALQATAQCLRQLTPATVYALFEYDSSADELTCRHTMGDDEHLIDGLTIKLGERVTGWSAANLRTSVNSNASLDLAQIASFFTPSLRSTICAPLAQGERLVGVLSAYSSKSEGFNESHQYAFEYVSRALLARMISLQPGGSQKVVSFSAHRA
jgi:putative nucleotidyltransferase with HDIG domain